MIQNTLLNYVKITLSGKKNEKLRPDFSSIELACDKYPKSMLFSS